MISFRIFIRLSVDLLWQSIARQNESKQLSELIELCKLQDSHKTFDPVGAKFTFCSPATKSRIDRIYASTEIRLISVEVLPN